ncbi:hypothetical protein C6497_15690 [Candidatus Poribacteria bacterium]|nr:MAG: hypothetical protein C6497_15690 [Candidatus Poribacteria bacterium]
MRLDALQITKNIGHLTIVKDVTLSINPGEVVAIFGPNGAGKTTLIKILSTLLRPTSGKLKIGNIDAIADYLQVRNTLGVIIHEQLAYPVLTPYENLKFFGQMYHVEDLETRCKTLLDEVGLNRFIHEPIHTFSRGMTQRFMIAKALLHYPSILLLDEPFSGLDASARQIVIDRIAKEQQNDRSVVITTHNIDLGYLVGTRFLFMINGELEEIAQKNEIDKETLQKLYEVRMVDTVQKRL